MAKKNQTIISEFLLLGLPVQPEHQNLFYALFLAMYVTTVLGNLLIMFLIRLDPHLHTPMYLFLSNLSFSDLCFSSVTMPKLLQNMKSHALSIPYAGCLAQMYFYLFFGVLESFLLVAMAYDRYVAICFPLHYAAIMSPGLCLALLALSWVLTTAHATLHTLLMAGLSFCADNVIPHFFCDTSTLLKLSCSDTRVNGLVILFMGGLNSHDPVSTHHHVLCTNCLLHPQSSFCQGYPQGLLHLWLPPLHGVSLLWDNYWSLLVPIN